MNPTYSQNNTLPLNGNVGIGTTSPTSTLQVNGTAKIDSALYVKDSVTIDRGAHVKGTLKVENSANFEWDLNVDNNLNVKGISSFYNDILLKNGDLRLESIANPTQLGNGILLIDNNGKVINGGSAKSFFYAKELPIGIEELPCNSAPDSAFYKPYWQNDISQMFLTGRSHCTPDPRLGVGIRPKAKFHILNVADSILPLLIEKQMGGTQPNFKLLELTNSGLLYAREVKVNTQNWPDFVFDTNYKLQPLSEVERFIQTNKHLPDVPSANEIETDGLNLGEMNKILLQKVEELTLHLIEQQKILESQQQMLLDQQQELNRIKVQSQK